MIQVNTTIRQELDLILELRQKYEGHTARSIWRMLCDEKIITGNKPIDKGRFKKYCRVILSDKDFSEEGPYVGIFDLIWKEESKNYPHLNSKVYYLFADGDAADIFNKDGVDGLMSISQNEMDDPYAHSVSWQVVSYDTSSSDTPTDLLNDAVGYGEVFIISKDEYTKLIEL